MIRFIAVTLSITLTSIALAATSTQGADELPIVNPGFEKGEGTQIDGWSWWSRTGKGSATLVKDDPTEGNTAARVVYDADRDWAFQSSKRFAVKPGQMFEAEANVKIDTGHVELAIVAFGDGKVVSWRAGGKTLSTADTAPGWNRILARAIVPDGADAIYVRFTGIEDTDVQIDDVKIRPWVDTEPNRPKVEGFAETRIVENLSRGLVAHRLEDGRVYLSWRLLPGDPADAKFRVFHCSKIDLKKPAGHLDYMTVTQPGKTTDLLVDNFKATDGLWFISLIDGKKETQYTPVKEFTGPCRTIKLLGDYTFQKVVVADLDGDGNMDFVIKQPGANIDPYEKYWKPSPETYKIEAYRHDGTPMWQYDMGWAIERGIWYSPYLVYDFDGDGKAEVVVKSGEGDPRAEDGRVKEGPEYVTILNGETGKPVTRVDWPDRSGFPGTRSYNYASRNQLGLAYLDGRTPCLIVARGTYNMMKAVAYQYRDGKLEELWNWSNADRPGKYQGQGAHWMHCADIDDDGRDEVMLGSIMLDDNGSILWSTGLGHPDHSYLGDLDPTHPGLEIYYGIETRGKENNMCMVDAETGKILWGHDAPTVHIHSTGMCSDIDASHPGCECYSGERDTPEYWLRTCKGEIISRDRLYGLAPKPVFWDADPQRELLGGSRGPIYNYPQNGSVGTIQGSVVAVIDLDGDWREEIITSEPGKLNIFSTTIPATDRRQTFLADPIYRTDTVHAGMGYYQVPMAKRWK